MIDRILEDVILKGDVVSASGRATLMTVGKITDHGCDIVAECKWFVGTTLHFGLFSLASLRKSDFQQHMKKRD